MARIIISGSSEQSRSQIAGLLSSSGYPVYRVCSSAGELRRVLNDTDDGLLILSGLLPDCDMDELYLDYGRQIQILVIARPPALESCESSGVFRLSLPTSQQAVLGAVEMLTQLHQMRLPRRDADSRLLVEKAKRLLMQRYHLTEPQAHRALQQYAMNHGLRTADYAARIISAMSRETEE